MLDFSVIFINTCSILMICAVILFSWKRRDNTCTTQLIIISIFMLIWSIGSFLEMTAYGIDQKIFWRNIEQIGVFGTPAATLIFSITYTVFLKINIKKISTLIYSFQAIAVLLIFTDKWHHLIRVNTFIVEGNQFDTLVVQTSTLARILISMNFIYMAVAEVFLIAILFSAVTSTMKKQALCVLTGMSISVVYALLKTASNEMFGIKIPISGIFALSDLFMLFGILRFDLIILTPLARNEVFNIIGDGIIVTTVTGKIVDLNRAAVKIFDCSEANINTPAAKKIERQMADLLPEWNNVLNSKRKEVLNFSTVKNDSRNYYLVEQYPVHSKKDLIGSISVIKDITEQKKNTDYLKIKAEKDGLTGAYNRRTFIDKFEDALGENGHVSLLYMDIDYFKNINDKYGHIFGDYVLIEFAKLIQSALDNKALLGRMGGEEFAVFQKFVNQEEALSFAEYLRNTVYEHKFLNNGTSIHVTVSIGVATGCLESFDTLYSIADENLYKAKKEGRNRVF